MQLPSRDLEAEEEKQSMPAKPHTKSRITVRGGSMVVSAKKPCTIPANACFGTNRHCQMQQPIVLRGGQPQGHVERGRVQPRPDPDR